MIKVFIFSMILWAIILLVAFTAALGAIGAGKLIECLLVPGVQECTLIAVPVEPRP